MNESRIPHKPISLNANSAEEKSKKRAEELRSSASSKATSATKKSPSKKTMEAAIVDEFNRTFAIVHTSSTYILIEKSESEFVLDSKTSLLNLFENQLVPELSDPNSKKILTKAQIWLKSPDRRTFRNIVFNPRIANHYDGNFNIWKGFAIEPAKGNCSLFWEHVKNIICCGKETSYIYVRKWLAHLIQKPWIIGTALILRGKQGTGKGTFVEAIGTLLGPHYAPLANLDQILGRFNAHLKNAILILADEAIWGGQRKEVGVMKFLITEPRLFIEAKGKDGYWIENFKHLIVSSNEDWAVHLDPDDRRFFVLDVSADRKEDLQYFGAIRRQLEHEGYEALMYDLLHEDLTGFDLKMMPENYSGFDMKLESASSIDRFLYASLKEGSWDHNDSELPREYRSYLVIDTFYGLYKDWCLREHQKVLGKAVLGKRLKKIIPGIQSVRATQDEYPSRPMMYQFPSLSECRKFFEHFYKQDHRIWEEWS